MDDYLAKPFRREQILAMLRRHVPRDREATPLPERVVPVTPSDDAGRLDPTALERLQQLDPDGSGGLVEKIVGTFIESSTGLVADLDTAWANGQADALYRAAHTLKSASANVGAMRLCALARELEGHARAGETERAAELVAAIARAHADAVSALRGRLREDRHATV
jgi:HPt (histidine-containing phosphotransfer) domain-containing protein